MKVTIPAKTIEITRCYHECPHFQLDGGPGAVMFCGHPFFAGKGYDAFIISHPDCTTGFPAKCPLRAEQ